MSEQEQEQEQASIFTHQVKLGLVAAYAAMLAFKKYKNSPVVVSRGGQILHIAAEDMPPPQAPPA